MRRQTIVIASLLLAACGSSPEPKKVSNVPVVSVKSEPKAPSDTAKKSPIKRKPDQSPSGEVVSITGYASRVYIKSVVGEGRTLDPDSLHPPPGNRAHFGIGAMSAAYLDDGTLLVGMADGTLIALDSADKRKWSVGFRGGITGITLAEENQIIISTQRGVVASLTADGHVRWEKQMTSGALTPPIIGPNDHIYVAGPRGVLAFSLEGELVFSHAASLPDDVCCAGNAKQALSVDAYGRITINDLDIRVSDPHPPIVSSEPVYLLNYEKVLDEKIASMLATGPDELLLLVSGKKTDEVLRFSGGKITKRIALPSRGAKADRVDEEVKPEKPPLSYDSLVMGPNGNPWLLARAIFPPPSGMSPWWSRPSKAMILELNGNTVRERNDLTTAFSQHWVTNYGDSRIRAAEEGTANVFCFGNESPACAIYEGNKVEVIERKVKTSAVVRLGNQTFVVPDHGKVDRIEGQQFLSLPSPENIRYSISAVGGTGENDLWFVSSGYLAYHYDGKTFTQTSIPQSIDKGILTRAPNDVWSRDGQVHWDGQRWSIVGGSPVASAMVIRGANDIWIGNGDGLYHGTGPASAALRLPAAKQVDTKPLDAPKTLPLGGLLSGYFLAKMTFPVNGADPLTTGKRVEVARDGTLWIEAWDKLVEIDAEGKTALIDDQEKRILFERWFYPEGPGRGIFAHRDRESDVHNERDKLRRFEGGKNVDSNLRLDGRDIVAIAGNQNGATWILGSIEAGSPYALAKSNVLEFGVHALVRADEKSKFQPVLGLPPISYVDVAVTPEGGAFLVGAQNAGPLGEGVLLHARGRSGSEALTRHRAPASLLAVAAVSNDEAWAVGAMGLVVHTKGATIERYALPSGEWLRSVVANGPNEVWFGGDGGTLVHYDGQAFHPVAQPLGPNASFSGLGISRGVVWAVSPSGILRLSKGGAAKP